MFSLNSYYRSPDDKDVGSSDIRHFRTTYGEAHGYNERQRAYHRSYNRVTPGNHPAFNEVQEGDLATASLYRRDALGFRREYWDQPTFSWEKKEQDETNNHSQSAAHTSSSTSSSSQSASKPALGVPLEWKPLPENWKNDQNNQFSPPTSNFHPPISAANGTDHHNFALLAAGPAPPAARVPPGAVIVEEQQYIPSTQVNEAMVAVRPVIPPVMEYVAK